MVRLTLSLLGGFEVRSLPGAEALALPRKCQALLAYLALSPGPATRAHLANLLWGETGRAQAQQSLRQSLTALRQALGDAADILAADGQSVTLDPRSVEIDARSFEALVARREPGTLERACELYRGNLLDGLDLNEQAFEEWLTTHRERLRELAMNAHMQLLGAQQRAGMIEEAVLTGARLVALDPLHEPAHCALMRLYAAQGRRPAALRQYQSCVTALQRELGVEPSEETKRVYAETLRESGAPAPPPGVSEARVLAEDRQQQIVSAGAAPLAGRSAELDRMRGVMAQAFAGRGAVAMISGEAGIGKTRLLRQVAAEAAQRGARVVLGRAFRAEQILPLGPWRDALREAGVLDDAAGVLDAADPVGLFTAVDALVGRLSAAQPLALLFEDLQWADDMSLRLLAYLARRVQGRRTLVAATLRDEELDEAAAPRAMLADLERDQRVTEIVLAPLSRDETGDLVRQLARVPDPAEAPRLAELVWTASEGNPFMVVELLRALDDGAVAASARGLQLPGRARQVVKARLERLGERARGLAGVASVIGRDFDFALLQRAANLDDAEAAGAVEELVRRRVFRVAGERFEFTHERIREIVYGELLAPRRRLLHRQAAQAIRAQYGAELEPHYAALGAHAFEGELWNEAADCLRRAGEWAMARSFNREAAAALERAVAALDKVPGEAARTQAIDVRLQLRNALSMSGEIARGRAPLDEAQRLAAALGDRVRLGRVAAHLSSDRWFSGRPAEALAAADEAARLAEETGDAALKLAAITGRGYAFHGMGNYRAVRETLEPLFDAPAPAGYGKDLLPIVSPLHQAIAGLAHCGDFAAALARAEEAVARAEGSGHRYTLLHACWTLGEVHAHRADAAAARGPLQRALGLILDRADFFIATGVLGCLGYVEVLAGEHEAGLARMRDALKDPPKWRIGLSRLAVRYGEACLIAGHAGDARAAAEQCLSLTRSHGERGYEAWALRLLGEIERGGKAQEHLATALEMSEELGMQPMAAHCHAGLARYHRRAGDGAAGKHHRALAAGLYREMGIAWWPSLLDADSICSKPTPSSAR